MARHARRRSSFALWLAAVKYSNWNTPANFPQTFGAADWLVIGTSRVVFDIGGDNG